MLPFRVTLAQHPRRCLKSFLLSISLVPVIESVPYLAFSLLPCLLPPPSRDENPVTATPLDSALTNRDTRNSFRIRSYENCGVSLTLSPQSSDDVRIYLFYIHAFTGAHSATPFFSHSSRNGGGVPPEVRSRSTRLGGAKIPDPGVFPPVPLQPTAFGATIRKGARFLHYPGKQLRSPRCLRIVSGHRGQLDRGPLCKSCLGPAF